jgi:hypothetical protein
MAVHEQNPVLTERSQRVVMEQFANTFSSQPDLENRRYDVKTTGNEVVFFITTESDMRTPVQELVADVIGRLNGRVRAKGRSSFYRTALSQPFGGYLEVSVDDSHTQILSIAAQSVPLRDLLKEIKLQVGGVSYLIPGECADRMVDWSFGEGSTRAEPKSVDTVMNELATLFNLKMEKKNGTYIFGGSCTEMRQMRGRPSAELFRSNFFPAHYADTSQVFVTFSPLGE